MLELKDIKKDYKVGTEAVQALKGVSITFRKSEFVSILGPSGCGKTTMLNIIGGLDQYTSGDLVIENKSTKLFKDKDWDAYRNDKVGFVFQNYYLIPHQTVISNVEVALTLSGVSIKERKERAKAALDAVGLADQANKKPNQLSGGQMQRVSIARALVNNPDIILADEPTGALDSNTSIQIMDVLAEIAKEKLVVMVTHNGELAKQYSNRIISLLDGEIVGDTNPYEMPQEVQKDVQEDDQKEATALPQQPPKVKKKRGKLIPKERTSMAFTTAIKLSFSNLLTKKVRTTITAVAASIGIVGVGLVLAISNGFSAYIKEVESTTLNSFPIMVNEVTYDQDAIMKISSYMKTASDSQIEAFPTDRKVSTKEATMGMGNSIEDMMSSFKNLVITNNLTENYFDYLNQMDKDLGYVHYIYNLEMNLVGNPDINKYTVVSQRSLGWQQLMGGKDFILDQYDVIEGRYPKNAFETVVFVDKYNRIEASVLGALGIDYTRSDIMLDELLLDGKIAFAENDAYYAKGSNNVFRVKSNVSEIYNSEKCHPINIVGVMRVKPGIDYEMMDTGVAYTKELVDFAFASGANSEAVILQLQLLEEAKIKHAEQAAIDEANGIKSNKDLELKNVLTGSYFAPSTNEILMQAIMGTPATKVEALCKKVVQKLGGDKTPTSAYIFPNNFNNKEDIKDYLDDYNRNKPKNEKVIYTDMAQTAMGMANEMIKIITIVLSCFAGISLLVSSVMIGIITYVSVVERTQEIGILRSIGARKLDIFNVFNAEATIIGFVSGVIGIMATYLLSIPINMIIKHFAGLTANIAALIPYNAVILVAISVGLTFVAGLMPSLAAARKNPVLALRTE